MTRWTRKLELRKPDKKIVLEGSVDERPRAQQRPGAGFRSLHRGNEAVETVRAQRMSGEAGSGEPFRPHLARACHQQKRQRQPITVCDQGRRSDRNEPLDGQPVGLAAREGSVAEAYVERRARLVVVGRSM